MILFSISYSIRFMWFCVGTNNQIGHDIISVDYYKSSEPLSLNIVLQCSFGNRPELLLKCRIVYLNTAWYIRVVALSFFVFLISYFGILLNWLMFYNSFLLPLSLMNLHLVIDTLFSLIYFLYWHQMQSVHITTNVVSSNPVYGEVYSTQHYVIKFVSDLRQVSGFLRVLQFPPPIKLTAMIWLKYC
jgi:hypothetical protein